MADWKLFSKVHKTLFNLSGGRLGASLAGLDMVIIDTLGRKSGQIRQAPAACYPYKDSIVVVASNNGAEKDPVWWLNLKASPIVNIHLGKTTLKVEAEELEGKERSRVWQQIIQANPRQKNYAAMTERRLAVIYLKPYAGNKL